MSRSLFLVLAVLALLVSVSAQSSSTSAYSRLSSSSSYVASNSSTGTRWVTSSSSSSSSSGYPSGTYSFLLDLEFGFQITSANVDATARNVKGDLIFNFHRLTGASNSSLNDSLLVTSLNGTLTTPGSNRRLLQASYPAGVTFVLLGTIVNEVDGFSTSDAVTQFTNAAKNGQLVAVYTNATIPTQTITVASVGAYDSSSSGLGTGAASSTASASAALLFAAVASLALLW